MSIILNWNKCQGDVLCGLFDVDLTHSHFNGMEGVYVIWHGGTQSYTVRVGHGVIRDRLMQHRQDPQVLTYKDYGLFVTWASVLSNQTDGVERYLGDKLAPKVGERQPDVIPIQVNLPW